MRNTGRETRWSRRGFLRLLGGLSALACPGRQVLGGGTPDTQAETFRKALNLALQGQAWTESRAVTLELPQLAENGAIVPATVESRLPNTTRIMIFAERNPGPLLAQFRFEPGTDPWASLRLKLNESGPVLAIAESEGRFFGTRRTVRVMVGGCG